MIKIPLDNISKKKYKNNCIKIIEKKPENQVKKKNKYLVLNTTEKNNNHNMIKCSYCNIFTDNLTLHHNLCKKQLEFKSKKFPEIQLKEIKRKKKLKQ